MRAILLRCRTPNSSYYHSATAYATALPPALTLRRAGSLLVLNVPLISSIMAPASKF